jgi:ATP-GRASP peptide maturase of grasp-with-spasm system
MILILSQDGFEITTEQVQDWIEHLGGDALRLNGEDLTADEPFALTYGGRGEAMEFQAGDRRFSARDVRAVWFRRWHSFRTLDYLEALGEDHRLGHEIRDHLSGEVRAVTGGLQVLLRHARWLTYPRELRLNKLEALSLAAEIGLEVPATLVTNDKARLREFRARHGRIIAKPAGEAAHFLHRGTVFAMYTAEVTDADLDRAPDRFFPTLAQELVEKAFEVRTFYLDGRCWSVAIFSQADGQTSLDFRRYNRKKPNRTVPYLLPAQVEARVRELMRRLDLTTGSVDLIRTPASAHVFLEVNPVGQFGMVSHPCNYRLEKRVAEHLVAMDTAHE